MLSLVCAILLSQGNNNPDSITYFSNGKIHERFHTETSSSISYLEYDSTGNIIREGKYEDGGYDSTMQVENPVTHMFEIVVVKNGLQKNGTWKEYYANGTVKSEEFYFHNSRKGKVSYWYDNGNVKETGEYFQDEFGNAAKIGKWYYYYYNGNMKREEDYSTPNFTTFSGDLQGKVTEYYENGNIHFIENRDTASALLIGEYFSYNENGKPTEYGHYSVVWVTDPNYGSRYQKSIKTGLWIKWSEKGRLEHLEKYDENGNLISYTKSDKKTVKRIRKKFN
ncbi:MAG TPA: hypothetical protein VL651_14095 [Bacteroidia bacterium]|jgi:antitoxin component YwqK of YwqJK toxin-antitoxin module|nr:hypothetical protein [Bacteroidia bacterium]